MHKHVYSLESVQRALQSTVTKGNGGRAGRRPTRPNQLGPDTRLLMTSRSSRCAGCREHELGFDRDRDRFHSASSAPLR